MHNYLPGLCVDSDEAEVEQRVDVRSEQETVVGARRTAGRERHNVRRLQHLDRVCSCDGAPVAVGLEQRGPKGRLTLPEPDESKGTSA